MAAVGQLQAGSPTAAVVPGRLSGCRAVPGSPAAAVMPLRLGSRRAVARSPAVAVVALRPGSSGNGGCTSWQPLGSCRQAA